MNEEKENFKYISNQDDLDRLLRKLQRGDLFSDSFNFKDRNLFLHFLCLLNVDVEKFEINWHYFDKTRNLHISESHSGYVWISTHGLVARKKQTDENLVNACLNQYTVLSTLIDKAIEISLSENVYDVDSHEFEYLSVLSPALFANILFYIEVFGKVYLKLNQEHVSKTHDISKIYDSVEKVMVKKRHKNTFFHVIINEVFKKIIEHVTSMPRGFKEHHVKYDDNPEDVTLIVFDTENLIKMKNGLVMANDFIYNYYYNGESAMELESGALDRLLSKAKTKEEKEKLEELFGYLK